MLNEFERIQQEQDADLTQAPAWLTTDPAYQAWSEKRRIENEQDFDAWLNSPEGQAWLAAEEMHRYPYGRPEQDTGWYWENPTWGKTS